MIRHITTFAVMYEKKGDHDSAIADFSAAIRLSPNDAWYYAVRGNAYKEKGDIDSAITDLGTEKNANTGKGLSLPL